MLTNITVGIVLIILNTIVHAIVTDFIMRVVKHKKEAKKIVVRFRNIKWLSFIVLLMVLTALIDAAVWALSYVAMGAIESFEKAMYFSVVTFTTLGYGDITLDAQYQLLASFEAAIGIIIFGWSTAIVMATVQKLYVTKSGS